MSFKMLITNKNDRLYKNDNEAQKAYEKAWNSNNKLKNLVKLKNDLESWNSNKTKMKNDLKNVKKGTSSKDFFKITKGENFESENITYTIMSMASKYNLNIKTCFDYACHLFGDLKK